MALSEKTAYLKGLYDGLGLSEDNSREARMLGAIVDVLQEIALHVDENEESISALDDEVFDLAEAIEGKEDDDEYDALYDDDDEDEDEETEEIELDLPVEIECPNCGQELTIDAEVLAAGELSCPNCGKELQVEVEFTPDEDNGEDETPF